MKIDINKVKPVPKSISKDFELCIFGKPDDEILNWINFHELQINEVGSYTNFRIKNDIILTELFSQSDKFEWLDGFSPNLNKKLHIGHFSNLVIGKAFKSLGICNKLVSIYGDTLDGEISKELAIEELNKIQSYFDFFPDKEFMASEMKYVGDLLKSGTGDYLGTEIFEIGEDKVVGIKSNGQTSYFYQDVALASILNSKTLYLTGSEQSNHFSLLKKLFPPTKHIGLGLVKISGLKMSSRLGNVILIEDFINQFKETFNGNTQLIYNVFAGFILQSSPEQDKGINLDIISNPKNSEGLYLSYTMARLISAGCEIKLLNNFISKKLEFSFLKAKFNFKPHILFKELIEHCKEINSLYLSNRIQGNSENKQMFELKLSDLALTCNKLGLFIIDKV